ncbi:hypothetical protein SKAU_G00323140 [Synaphobranchus kaupii]|uniref:Uncharacterized protein n=1 Tax=Synaphobranchus kaupii TaxID=118154 RepID=A0A9Q1EP20_SYNKA|nr:hypothetical protein SKAU_G00323140 [Synaphobranchus kaupii]
MEDSQQDSLIHLVWEVNMRLKLLDISRDLGLTPSMSQLPALNVYDTQHAAVSDLESTAFNKAAVRRYPRSCFDRRSVVQRAVKYVTEVLARPPARPAHTVSEVVGETVTSLLCAVMETANETASSRAFSDVAVGVVVCVLEDLRAAGWGGEQVLGVRCWRWARASVVGALHRDLLEQTGSPGGLQAALRGNNATVTTAITAAIKTLLTSADATPNASPTVPEQKDWITPPEREELVTPSEEEELVTLSEEEELVTLPEEEELVTPPDEEELVTLSEGVELVTPSEGVELVTPPEEEELVTPHDEEERVTPSEGVELVTPPEEEELVTPPEEEERVTPSEGVELVTAPEGVELVTLPEEEEGQLSSMKPLAEERGVQDEFEVENTAPLGRAAGEPLDLPQKKKQKKGVGRFFSRLWKVLKHTCCCCCSVSVETD